MRIASSLTRDFSSFVAEIFRVVGFFRGELALLAAGFAAFPFSAAPLDGAFSLSLSFAFFAMVKQYRFTRPSWIRKPFSQRIGVNSTLR